MRYYGTILGAVIGLLLMRHVIGAIIGGFIGYAFDAGWLNTGSAPRKRGDDPYETLGITPDATDAEVEQAYRKRIAQYHPDKVAGAADEIRTLAGERASAINRAYETIQRERRGRS